MKIRYLRDITNWVCDWCGTIRDIVHDIKFDEKYVITLCDCCLYQLLEFLNAIGIEYEEVYE
jgi:predicted nucleic acid-binding Zn ribbon protein